jgi:Flagellar biosynthesis protein, FliO
MTFFGRLALACALTLTVTGVGWAQTLQAPPAPPSMGGIVWRVAGALAVVGALLTVTLAMLRGLTGGRGRQPAIFARGGPRSWLARWQRAGTRGADRLEILDRRPVGAKESVCVVRAGREQFLIGVTASQISLLGRLGPVVEAAAAPVPAPAAVEAAGPLVDVEEPTAADFARGLGERRAARSSPRAALPADSTQSGPDEASFHLLLARSRDRLSRLGLHSVHAGAPRE